MSVLCGLSRRPRTLAHNLPNSCVAPTPPPLHAHTLIALGACLRRCPACMCARMHAQELQVALALARQETEDAIQAHNKRYNDMLAERMRAEDGLAEQLVALQVGAETESRPGAGGGGSGRERPVPAPKGLWWGPGACCMLQCPRGCLYWADALILFVLWVLWCRFQAQLAAAALGRDQLERQAAEAKAAWEQERAQMAADQKVRSQRAHHQRWGLGRGEAGTRRQQARRENHAWKPWNGAACTGAAGVRTPAGPRAPASCIPSRHMPPLPL